MVLKVLSPPSDVDGTLRVSIPVETPLRPVLGSKVVVPCYFQDHRGGDPGAPTAAPLQHRIKWSYITGEGASTILVASGGRVHVEAEYLDRVTMSHYPLVSTDASIEMTELRSRDSGTYRCQVMLGLQDNHDSVSLQVQGESHDGGVVGDLHERLSVPSTGRSRVPLPGHHLPLQPDL